MDGNPSTKNSQKKMDKWSTTVRFAGDSGDGMQLTGGRLTLKLQFQVWDLLHFQIIQLKLERLQEQLLEFLHFKLDLEKDLIASSGDHADILVAMNPAALKMNIKEVIPGGLIIIDNSSFNDRGIRKAGYSNNPIEDNSLSGMQLISADISNLTIEAVKDFGLGQKDGIRCRNMWTLGLILWLFSKNSKQTEEWLIKKFGKDNVLTKANIAALKAGSKYAENTEISNDILRKEVPKVNHYQENGEQLQEQKLLHLVLATGAQIMLN